LKRQSVKGLLSAVLKESHSDKGTGTGTGTGTGAKIVAAAGAGREREAVRVKVRRSETKQNPVSPGGTAVTVESVISVHNSSSNSSSSSRGIRNEVRRSRTNKEAEIGYEVEEDGEEDQDEWSDGNNSEYVEEEGREDDEERKHNGKKRHEEDSLESEDEGKSESSEEEGKIGKKKKKKRDTIMKAKSRIKRKISQVDTDAALRPCTSIGKGGGGSLSFPAVVTSEILLDLVLPRGIEYVLARTTKGRMDSAEKGMTRVRDDVERDDPVLQQLHSLMGGDLLYIHPV
jgi:hypothetical protein